MANDHVYPVSMNRNLELPPKVLAAIAGSEELQTEFGSVAIVEAGLNVVGYPQAVFIPNGGTTPVEAGPYTIVIEME